jgi:hypothetical protein
MGRMTKQKFIFDLEGFYRPVPTGLAVKMTPASDKEAITVSSN